MLTSQLLGRLLDRLLTSSDPPPVPSKSSPGRSGDAVAASSKAAIPQDKPDAVGVKASNGGPMSREAIADQLDEMDVTPPLA